MEMMFGPNDEDAFQTTRAALLDRFGRWLSDRQQTPEKHAAEMAGDAGLALDWKWSYSDGHLGRWRTQDVSEFLLEWCPRKLSVSQAECLTIPASLVAFTAFLHAEGSLSPGSSSLAALAETAAALAEEFVAAMGDVSNFGLAKSLFSAASADGVDMSDPDRLHTWMAEFNARPEQERRRVIPDSAVGSPKRPVLPPVTLPGDVEVAASRTAAPILETFARFASFVGAGRKLTQTGNLTLADARALVDLLGTGDAIDERIGDRTFKTRSATELPRLRQIFAWARKAGVVRVAHGRVIATKAGLAMAGDPAAFFDRSVDALLAIGPLTSQRDPSGWLAWPEVNELVDRFALHLLTGPYVAQRPVPIDDLASLAAGAVLDVFEFASLGDDDVARRVGNDVVDVIDALELAGMVRRSGIIEEPDTKLAGRRRQGGCVELTAAGMATTHRLLTDAGYQPPTAGHFSAATAAELLVGTDLEDFIVLWSEIEAWRRRLEPAEAARQLADAVRELGDPALRNLALAIMGDLDPAVAGPEVRRLATEPAARGIALCWLVDHGLEDPQALFDPDDVAWFVDVLAQRLVTAGPEGLCDTLALTGGHDRQIRVIGQIWRSPSMATDLVLAAVGELHPTKIVAKAARKARFQRRSWAGT